jgi:hypothetical protein
VRLSAHSHTGTLRQLIEADCYVVAPVDVADAILMRCATRLKVAGATFRNDLAPQAQRPVRSFRLDERVPSFRACGPRVRVRSRR